MNSMLETSGILNIVDTQIIPLMDLFYATKNKDMAECLLEFGEILRYHYPECYKECQKILKS